MSCVASHCEIDVSTRRRSDVTLDIVFAHTYYIVGEEHTDMADVLMWHAAMPSAVLVASCSVFSSTITSAPSDTACTIHVIADLDDTSIVDRLSMADCRTLIR